MTAIDKDILLASMPLAVLLGIELQRAEADGVDGTIGWAEDRTTAAGILHGGALMTLADTLGGVCAFLNLPEGAGTSTIESKTNFMRAVRSGTARATTRPLHVGRQTIVLQTEIRDDAGKLVAMLTQTQAVLQSGRCRPRRRAWRFRRRPGHRRWRTPGRRRPRSTGCRAGCPGVGRDRRCCAGPASRPSSPGRRGCGPARRSP